MIEICWNWWFFFQVSCKVILYIIFFYWAKCIAWCKVFESHLFSVALEHYSSEMCFSATVVHKDVLLKFVSSSQWVIQPMQLVHMSVLDDWCNKGCQTLLSDADPELLPFIVLVPLQSEIVPFRESPSTDVSTREVICSHFPEKPRGRVLDLHKELWISFSRPLPHSHLLSFYLPKPPASPAHPNTHPWRPISYPLFQIIISLACDLPSAGVDPDQVLSEPSKIVHLYLGMDVVSGQLWQPLICIDFKNILGFSLFRNFFQFKFFNLVMSDLYWILYGYILLPKILLIWIILDHCKLDFMRKFWN